MHEALDLVPSSVNKPDVVTYLQNPSTRETEKAGSEVQAGTEFKATLGYVGCYFSKKQCC